MSLLADVADYPAVKVVTSVHGDENHVFSALRQGADGYLLKDERPEVLMEELQRIA